jgi:prevent-host-death family protein
MRKVASTAARNHLSRLLESAYKGPIAITRRGRVVAYVIAPKDFAKEASQRLQERIADRLSGAGARYATLFGSVARGKARFESDIDVAVSFGTPMSSGLREVLVNMIADVAGRPVDLVDLDSANVLVFAQAMRGKEILCDHVRTRQRLIQRLLRSEDERRSIAIAAKAARKLLFP